MKLKLFLLASVCMTLILLVGCGNSQNLPNKVDTQDDIDTNADAVHSEDYEKIHSILKNSEFYDLDEAEALMPYYQRAAERKEAILNSPTEIVKADEFIPGKTYTGTAYYISPNGDNENDGLSPETAWKTAQRANWGDVHEKDAVFFERGGIYPLDERMLTLVSCVTYSAYGVGAKPVITLAQENSARPECWELWHEGENGEKIWLYYQQVRETGGIVFDDTLYAKRVYEWPTPNGWMALDIQIMDPANGVCAAEDPCAPFQVKSAGEYRTVEEQLTEDMTYLCRMDIGELTYPMVEYRVGELYLRCDEGNPGEHFEQIFVISLQMDEYGEYYGGILDGAQANGWVLDNLSLKYYLDNAVFGFISTGKDAVLQNCTVEWGGNRLHQIQSAEPTNGYMLIGDGIYCVANNATIRNNYIRHSGNGCTFESSMEAPADMGTYTATGNLIENCGQGIRVALWEQGEESAFDRVLLQDNIILDTGNSMNNACWEEPVAIDLGWDALQYADHIEVSDNVIIGSTVAVFRTPDSTEFKMDIHDNVIAQSKENALITECGVSGGVNWYMMENAKE